MGTVSIMFRPGDPRRESREEPAFFHDLNLDQVVAEVTLGRQDYDLLPFFYTMLPDLDAIRFRQEVMRDFEGEATTRIVREFSSRMRTMRGKLLNASKVRYRYEQQRWHLAAVEEYCAALEQLQASLAATRLRSRGMTAFSRWLADHVRSAELTALTAETRQVAADLAAVRYTLLIDGGTIEVRPFLDELDYAAEIQETFLKFRRAGAKEHTFNFSDWVGMNHIEAQVLDHVAQLNPEAFAALDAFASRRAEYVDPTIATFDRECQFYVGFLDYVARFRGPRLNFCSPELSDTSKEEDVRETFDLALAQKLLRENRQVVTNDFYLRGRERVFVVSGPNQGGKTTFARTFGQVHHLASIGCLVPGSSARLFLPDRIFAHFEREEDVANLRGKLHDDLVRIRNVLEAATPRSVIVMNEIFSSTTLGDAVFLSKKILGRISALDALCVCVTFLGELATLNAKTVSVVSGVDKANPAIRTFKLERRPDEGVAYALAVAEQHKVTYEWLKERIRP